MRGIGANQTCFLVVLKNPLTFAVHFYRGAFLFGAAFFHEKNLKAKAFDLALVLLGMLFLYIGSK